MSMTSRERVLKALNFEQVDRLPCDLGGMASTGISAFAYSALVKMLGLNPRKPRIHDSYQMLALPDMDVLDALGCDVVSVFWGVTNAFEEPEKWQEYDFNGRLPAMVRNRNLFTDEKDGTIIQPNLKAKMPPTSTVFNEEHGGQPFELSGSLPKPDIEEVRKQQKAALPTDEEIKAIVDLCKNARQLTDKAIFFNGPINVDISITSPGGIAIFPILCLTEPGYVADLHGLLTEYAIKRIEILLPSITQYVDIIMLSSNDLGTQNNLIAPPYVYENLFMPYLKKINDKIHLIAPDVKTFLHSCGAIYGLIDLIIESGFDVLNPVQWPAGGKQYCQWKDKARNRIALWGGGVDTQHTLPQGSVNDIEKEVTEITKCMSRDGGYVFNAIHNLLAEIAPEKIIAMYRAANRI